MKKNFKYLVAYWLRYDSSGVCLAVPYIACNYYEVDTLSDAIVCHKEEFTLLNPVMAIVDVSWVSSHLLKDLEVSLIYTLSQ